MAANGGRRAAGADAGGWQLAAGGWQLGLALAAGGLIDLFPGTARFHRVGDRERADVRGSIHSRCADPVPVDEAPGRQRPRVASVRAGFIRASGTTAADRADQNGAGQDSGAAQVTAPFAGLLPDGRLHLRHGAIDIVVSADGRPAALETAFRAAAGRFASIRAELIAELPELRRAADTETEMAGLVSSRMARAVAPHAGGTFITPITAMSGAVADEILDAMTAAAPLTQAFVNNGRDIAVHLRGRQTVHARIAADDGNDPSVVRLTAGNGIGGIATDGWRGGASLGIADRVTVLAASAAKRMRRRASLPTPSTCRIIRW